MIGSEEQSADGGSELYGERRLVLNHQVDLICFKYFLKFPQQVHFDPERFHVCQVAIHQYPDSIPTSTSLKGVGRPEAWEPKR